jgi:hypothetical protein
VHRRAQFEAEEADHQGDDVQAVGERPAGLEVVADQLDGPAVLVLGPRLDATEVGQQRLLVALVGQEDLEQGLELQGGSGTRRRVGGANPGGRPGGARSR